MTLWMLGCMVAAALVGAAALALEEVARLVERPRRWGWVLGLAGAAGLPLALRLLPAPHVPRPEPGAEADPALLAELLARGGGAEPHIHSLRAVLTGATADRVLLLAWLIAAAAAALALTLTYRRLRRVAAEGDPAEISGLRVRLTAASGPMVVGVRRPEVVVPRWVAVLPEEERRLVVRHEWEHVRAGDARLLLLGAVLVALMPWNLPLWWMQRRLRLAVEVDCDARVLAAGADRRLYGGMLIRTAAWSSASALIAPALIRFPSFLERRIVAMTTKTPARPGLRLIPPLVLGSALLAAACELTPRASSPAPLHPTPAEVTASSGADRGGEAELDTIRVAAQAGRAPSELFRDRMIFLDGERIERMPDLSPDRLPRISVQFIEGARAVERFGPEAANGVVLLTTRGHVEGSARRSAPGARIRVAGDTIPRSGEGRVRVRTPGGPGGDPLYFVDGRRVESIGDLDPQRVEKMEIVKGPAAVERFGPEARDGAVLITMKAPGSQREGEVEIIQSAPGAQPRIRARGDLIEPLLKAEAGPGGVKVTSGTGATPLYYVDGVRVGSISGLESSRIAEIEVVKGAAALERFGPEARDGVVLITTKR